MRASTPIPTLIITLTLAALGGACTNTDFSVNADSGSGGDGHALDGHALDQIFNQDLPPLPDGYSPYSGDPVVFAHSASQLYRVDPQTLTVTLVGAFKWPGGSDQMTDIALDRKGKMTGISFGSVYAVDPKTAACTFLSKLQAPFGIGSYNGLSYIAVQASDVKEVLMASAGDGSLYEVNPATGQSKKIGNFGGGLGSSGDLVSVKGLTLATVEKGSDKTDWLASVNPLSGQATLIGDTGFEAVWGLGYWKDKVYGFTENKQIHPDRSQDRQGHPGGHRGGPLVGRGGDDLGPGDRVARRPARPALPQPNLT